MKKAFTLSEVLITLAIIGVVSVLTLPNIYKKVNSKIMVETLKNTYSQLVDAMRNKLSDEGVYIWQDVIPDSNDEMPSFTQEFLTEYLDVVKVCQSFEECFADSYSDLSSSGYVFNHANNYFQIGNSVILNNKATVMFTSKREQRYAVNEYFNVYVDVNGKLPPNILGVDFFNIDVLYNDVTSTNLSGACLSACAHSAGHSPCCFSTLKANNWEPLKY